MGIQSCRPCCQIDSAAPQTINRPEVAGVPASKTHGGIESAPGAPATQKSDAEEQTERHAGFRQLQRCESKDENAFIMNRDITAKLVARLGFNSNTRRRSSVRGSLVGTVDEGDGFVINTPVTSASAEELRKHYATNGVFQKLHRSIATEILLMFTMRYGEMHPESVVEVSVPKGGQLVVVGDTHGQLQDVLTIFHIHGPPSATNVYLFNGDIADRGPNSCEIFFLLFVYFLAEPTSILINRGNHENEDMNSMEAECGGGFMDEVLDKYDQPLYMMFVGMMKSLQLCTIIGKSVFVVHGGLWPGDLSIAHIRSIDHKEFTAPDPQSAVLQDQTWNNMLWSDPVNELGMAVSHRGIGVLFGPDISNQFCKTNAPIGLIIRSHQVPADEKGFEMMHNGRCITIFSASNYCGDTGNNGGVMVFKHDCFPEGTIHEFYSLTLDKINEVSRNGGKTGLIQDWLGAGKKEKQQDDPAMVAKWKRKELQSMMVCVVEKKADIWERVIHSIGGTTSVDQRTWEGVLSSCIGGEWRWGLAWDAWQLGAKDNKVNFKQFLQRFTVKLAEAHYMAFKFKAITTVYEQILSSHSRLEDTIHMFDKDGDGCVDMKEMFDVLSSLQLGINSAQLNSLVHTLFVNADEVDGAPTIAIKDFLGRFTMVYKQAEELTSGWSGLKTEEKKLAEEALSLVGRLIVTTPVSVLEAATETVVVKLTSCKPGPARAKARASVAGNFGRPSIMPFGHVKSESPRAQNPNSKWRKIRLVYQLNKAFGNRKSTAANSLHIGQKLEAIFRSIDVDQSGFLEAEEFVQGIWGIPGVPEIKLSNGEFLTEQRLHSMAKMLEHSGSISVLDFLNALCFEDAGGDDMADSIAEHMLSVLFRHRQSVRAGARCFDPNSTGKVTEEEFEKVLHALNWSINEHESTFPPSQVSHLCESLADENRHISYEDFFDSFEVIDSENPSMGVMLGRRSKGGRKSQ